MFLFSCFDQGVIISSCMDGASVNQGCLSGINVQLFGAATEGVHCMAHQTALVSKKISKQNVIASLALKVRTFLTSIATQFRQSSVSHQRFFDIQDAFNECMAQA